MTQLFDLVICIAAWKTPMRITRLASLFVVAAFSVNSSFGIEWATVGDWLLEYTDPIEVGNDLKATTLSVTNLSGDPNRNINGLAGTIGGEGLLHHEHLFNGFGPTPLPSSFQAAGQVSPIDSHFLQEVTVAPVAPAEEGDLTPSGETPNSPGAVGPVTGFGGPLTAQMGFIPATTVDLAYLVVSRDTFSIPFSIELADGTTATDNAVFEGELIFGHCDFPPFIESDVLIDNAVNTVSNPISVMLSGFYEPPGVWEFSDFAFTPDPRFPGGDGPAQPASIDPETGEIAWDPVGSPNGLYTWTVRVENGCGEDFGFFSVSVVPEPASMALAGLALANVIRFARRRIG